MEGGGPMKGTSSGILSYSFSTHGSACKVFQQGLTTKNTYSTRIGVFQTN